MGLLSLQTPPSTPPSTIPPHIQARACLRATSNAPHASMSYEGREKEVNVIREFLDSFGTDTDDDAKSKSILYISGSPGTGKSALVNSILTSSQCASELEIRTIFLNCMAFRNVDVLWDRLAEEFITSTAKRTKKTKKLSSRDLVIDFLEQNQDRKW